MIFELISIWKNSGTGKILMKKHETILALKKHESKKWTYISNIPPERKNWRMKHQLVGDEEVADDFHSLY